MTGNERYDASRQHTAANSQRSALWDMLPRKRMTPRCRILQTRQLIPVLREVGSGFACNFVTSKGIVQVVDYNIVIHACGKSFFRIEFCRVE